jgi:F0F1-type ATP synthase assembly protein I
MEPEGGQPETPTARAWTVPVYTAVPVDTPVPVIGRRAGELLAKPNALPFSAAALEELKIRIDGYMVDVVSDARRIARRQQADVISPAYVRQASDSLVARKGRRQFALAGSVGGMLIGAALPSLLDAAAGKPTPPIQIVGSAILGMLGTFLIAVQFFRE